MCRIHSFIHSFIAWCCAENTNQPLIWAPGGNSVASVGMQSMWNISMAVSPCSKLLQRLWRAPQPSESNPERVLFFLNFSGHSLVQFRINSYLKAPKQEPHSKFRVCTELFPTRPPVLLPLEESMPETWKQMVPVGVGHPRMAWQWSHSFGVGLDRKSCDFYTG